MGQDQIESDQWAARTEVDFPRCASPDVASSQGGRAEALSAGEVRVCPGEVVRTNPVFEPNPGHYTRLDPQPIEVCTRWNLPYPLSSAIKYLARAGHKGGESTEKDLRKAVTFIEWYIDYLKRTA